MTTEASTPSVVRVLGMHHAGLPVNDLDRAIKFYTEVLGFELLGTVRGPTNRGHFLGAQVPTDVVVDDPQAQRDYEEYVARYQEARPGKDSGTQFARLRVGRDDLVLFQRPEPVETDSLMESGILHQSFHISPEDMDRLAEMKRRGGSDIRFSNGPALRWPHGRALYMWDSEGNYLELESEEDVAARLTTVDGKRVYQGG